MDATRILRDEHQVILRVLDRFEAVLSIARESGKISAVDFEPYLEFFRGFADRCHHGKEEDKLFPCLNRCGVPCEAGPIAVMLEEHRQGRLHVRSMAECLAAADSGDAAAQSAFLQHGYAFFQLLRNHIGKEDNVLFHMADQLVQGQELERLKGEYRAVAQDHEYDQAYQRCRSIADQLTS